MALTGEIEQIPPGSLEFYLRHYHQGVKAGLALHPRAEGRKQSPARNLLERLRDRAHEVLRFADHPRQVPFTNEWVSHCTSGMRFAGLGWVGWSGRFSAGVRGVRAMAL